ncbi:MAG TPA: hypothetical protein VKA50_05275 [Gammaproteobacteria bacterium]|nr:hypothetical protein [Gammaproteobacteria bacterium]
MRHRGLHHIELSVLDGEASIALCDRMFGRSGYRCRCTCDVACFPFIHGSVGIQPAGSGERARHPEWTRHRRAAATWRLPSRRGRLH